MMKVVSNIRFKQYECHASGMSHAKGFNASGAKCIASHMKVMQAV